ncbi:MAG: Npt1/Npt2 family nucleotide transporter [Candidatus Symbiodolus clandestinus]
MKPIQTAESPFGKMRSLLFPIHFYELKKFLPMFLMFFFISFNYSIMRNTKDALLVGAAQTSGAEILPYIKFWGVTPAAILFIIAYSKLSNLVNKPTLFYIAISFFIGFFSLFALVLYPNHQLLHPVELSVAFLPQGFTEVIRLWSFSLFYIFSELWGSVALSLLFWQFANQITKVNEAKRFYALFGIGANLALVVAGDTIGKLSKIAKVQLLNEEAAMAFNIKHLSVFFVLSSLAIIAIYWWINRCILTDTRFYDPALLKQKGKKLKLGLLDSIKMLMKSRYLICIALLVICYGISINLIEVVWKSYLKVQYPNKADYLNFMGIYSKYLGWTTIAMMLFIAGNVIRKFGWTIAALVTPVAIFVLGLAFFNLIIFEESFKPWLSNFNILWLAVLFGTVQNILSKAAKYSLFDPTKEMAYIPLDEESKVKGKAAIDVVGARFGKAGGSIIYQLLLLLGSISFVLPYIEVIFIVCMILWIWSATDLGRSFSKITQKNDAKEKEGRKSCAY